MKHSKKFFVKVFSLMFIFLALGLSACGQVTRPEVAQTEALQDEADVDEFIFAEAKLTSQAYSFWNESITLSYWQMLSRVRRPDVYVNGLLLDGENVLDYDRGSVTFVLEPPRSDLPRILGIEVYIGFNQILLNIGGKASYSYVYAPEAMARSGRLNSLFYCESDSARTLTESLPSRFSLIDFFGLEAPHPQLGRSLHRDPWCFASVSFDNVSTDQAIQQLYNAMLDAGIIVLAISPDFYVYGSDPVGRSFDTECSQQGRLSREASSAVKLSENLLRTLVGASRSPYQGRGSTVVIIDGGVSDANSFLRAKPSSYLSRSFLESDYPRRSANYQAITDDFDCVETSFFDGHGSLVTRLIETIAPGADIIMLKACDGEGLCSSSSLAKALLYLRNRYQGFPQVDIINMSLGGRLAENWVLELLLEEMIYEQDSLLVTSIGNNPNDEAHFPAQYQEDYYNVIAVAALKTLKH
ncbi:MAG: S8/S53 family peptidase [Deinococcales bacterium]